MYSNLIYFNSKNLILNKIKRDDIDVIANRNNNTYYNKIIDISNLNNNINNINKNNLNNININKNKNNINNKKINL